MNRLKLVKWVMVSVSVVMLSACGGGGGDSAPSTPVAPTPSTPVAPTPEEIQQEAIDTINNYDGSEGTEAPTIEDYENAGVTGVNEGNIDSINEAIVEDEDDSVATEDDIQDVVDVAGLVYEDAENGDTNGWDLYDNEPVGATITNIIDDDKVAYDDKGNRVIKLSGASSDNGYRFGAEWNNDKEQIITWSMKYNHNEPFNFFVWVETKNGWRYISYTDNAVNDGSEGVVDVNNITYIRHSLGADKNDGRWQTLTRNLEEDIKKYEPDNELLTVHYFQVRGSGLIDDIEFK